MRSVRYSQRNNHGQDTDTKTSNETTTVNVVDILSACLNDDTDHEDNNTNLSGDFTTELVGVVSVDQYTNPCSEFEDAAQVSETYVCVSWTNLRSQETSSSSVFDGFWVDCSVEGCHVQNLSEHSLVV